MAGMVHEACEVGGPVDRTLIFSLIVGILSVVINSIQIWFLRKRTTGIEDSYKPFLYR